MLTFADCLAGECPCAGPVNPGPNHQCPADPRSFEERELEQERQLNRPFEECEGTSIHWP